jgi:hypothetical protein
VEWLEESEDFQLVLPQETREGVVRVAEDIVDKIVDFGCSRDSRGGGRGGRRVGGVTGRRRVCCETVPQVLQSLVSLTQPLLQGRQDWEMLAVFKGGDLFSQFLHTQLTQSHHLGFPRPCPALQTQHIHSYCTSRFFQAIIFMFSIIIEE